MKDFILTKSNLAKFVELIQDELENKPSLVVTTQADGIGKWGMARLWRAWMATTAKFMADNGAKMPLCYDKYGKAYGSRRFTPSDAHELFTAHWMNVDADGVRLSWAKTDNAGMRKATKGERYFAMMKHENYCINKGIFLFNPRGSEFCKLKEQQNQ